MTEEKIHGTPWLHSIVDQVILSIDTDSSVQHELPLLHQQPFPIY